MTRRSACLPRIRLPRRELHVMYTNMNPDSEPWNIALVDNDALVRSYLKPIWEGCPSSTSAGACKAEGMLWRHTTTASPARTVCRI